MMDSLSERLHGWRGAYDDLMINRRDPRVDGWFLMSSPIPTLAICLSYVVVVKILGPRLMKKRPPMNLRLLLVVYNFAQMLFSAWLFYRILFSGWIQKYSLRCQPVDYSSDPLAVSMVYASWWYYLSKFTEFFDTFFFVLRKKDEHVSALHVVHHGVMPMSVWFGVKFTPGGHSTFFGLLNTFVHIVMYFYYMLAAVGPSVHKYLWWKKYLTALQMVQFIGIFTHAFQLLFIDCDYPRAFVWWIGGHAVLFFFLFFDFWQKAYRTKRAAAVAAGRGKRDPVTGKPVVTSLDNMITSSISNKMIPCFSGSDLSEEGLGMRNGFRPKRMSNGSANHNGHAENGDCGYHGGSNGVSRSITSNGKPTQNGLARRRKNSTEDS